MMENIHIFSDDLSVEISPFGAELQSIVDKNGVERLWQGDEKVWAGRAPVLFPFAGSLKDGYFLCGGRKCVLPPHGFAHLSEFQVEKRDKGSVTFLLNEQNPDYPFLYEFRVRFSIRQNAIRIDYIARNAGDIPMYYGVGAHEAYACPEGIEHYSLVFDKEETLRHSILEGAQITPRLMDVTNHSKLLKLRTELFRNDSLVFLNVHSRGVTLESDQRKERVRVDFDGFDYLLVWQRPRAKYICIEPWTNPPEYVTSDHILSHKPGMSILPPGKEETHTHTITFL